MDDGYLCGSISDWQTRRIKDLSITAEFHYPDMAWSVEGNVLPDIRHVYSCSSFFRALFESKMNRENFSTSNGVPIYSVSEKFHIFDMIRVYCHTGLVRFGKGETILKTLERYSAFQFYDVEGGRIVLKKLLIDKMTPSNATQAFEYAIHRNDQDLLRSINEYICAHAFVVLKHRNFFNIRRESMHDLALLCSSDNLNIPEIELLGALYRLCEKKVGDKEYTDFDMKKPSDILKHEFNGKSLWDTIRLKQISLPDFMGFVQSHEKFLDNDAIVEAMKIIYDPSGGERKRKRFQMISSYPRNLSIQCTDSPQADVTHLEKDKVQAFMVFDLTKKEELMLPHITYGDRTVRCIVRNVDKTICVKGTIFGRNQTVENKSVKVTTSIVNFKHDRWKKTTVLVNLGIHDFEVPNMISWNAIDSQESGYLFDIRKYPEYVVGCWLMMYISVDGTST